MDKLKQWVALTVVGVLAIAAAGWFLLISPKRAEAADIRLQADAQLSTNAGLKTEIQRLKAQAKQLPQQQAKLAAVAAKIPDNPALPTLIRALTKAADDAGVELVSLAPSAPAPVVAAMPGAVSGVQATPATSGAGATKTSGAATSTARPVASNGTLQAITLSVNVVGGYFQVEQFLDRVEGLSRAMKVSTFNLAPGTNPLKASAPTTGTDPGKVLSATITGTVYMATGRVVTAAPAVGK